MLVFVEVQIASADTLVAEHAVGRGELGHNQPASAEILDEAAKDGVGDAGHGSEHGGGGDSDPADQKAGGEHPWLCLCGAGALARCPVCGKMLTGRSVRPARVVPELVHVSILDCSAKSEAPADARA